jgi:hypothetical protein
MHTLCEFYVEKQKIIKSSGNEDDSTNGGRDSSKNDHSTSSRLMIDDIIDIEDE